ncbi:PAN domain-containing protein [Bradyrhizobium sp. SZCCHNPS2010]|uniref:PAN domain-containing protein n=1 Tax=Bradyrhizobium sp. SZCCHNPS2010 TaxID=3057333 RepID=UPI0029163142|nr:PAN domain-containing protein [Bradyrhizobium sp. SZCCHNPS2010]
MAQTNTGDALANDLKLNVVRVISRWTDGTQERSGFGFVVGVRDGNVYIVTADHVVRNDNLMPGTPAIVYYEDQGKEYQGYLLNTYLVQSAGDVAVIRVQTPAGFSWQRAVLSTVKAERGDDARYVGAQGKWIVPARPGAVNGVDPSGTIRFEGLVILAGTSGGPLVGNKGILGMVVSEDAYGEATPIEVIERAFREWSYPFELVKAAPPLPLPIHSQVGERAPQLTPPPPQSENWVNRYTTRDNRDLWLGDMPQPGKAIGTRNVDLDECARQCDNRNECVAFAYDRWNRSCYSKSEIKQSIIDPHSLIAVKKPGDLPSVSQKTPEMVILRNKRMHGDVTSSAKVADYKACSSVCEGNIQCVTFNFLKRATDADNCQMFKLSKDYADDSAVDAGYKRQVP